MRKVQAVSPLIKNEAYSVTTEDETLNEDGFTTVTVKNVKSWNTKEDGKGDTYNPKDLLVYNDIDRIGASVDFPLYAQWDENSGVEFNGIHGAYELTQFAKVVNAGKATANGILLADIDMSRMHGILITIHVQRIWMVTISSGVNGKNGKQ